MAGYRQIHTKIWKDEWFIELTNEEKLLFIYLFSNDEASIAGLYKLPIRVIANETGLDRAVIEAALKKFEQDKKVYYQDGVIWVVNMTRYHANSSPLTIKKRDADIAKIADCKVKRLYQEGIKAFEDGYLYGIDTTSKTFIKAKSEEESEAKSEEEDSAADAANSAPKKHREPSEKELMRAELQKHFLVKTGLPAPRVSTKTDAKAAQSLWFGPLMEILDLSALDVDVGRRLIDLALSEMGGLTISDPHSIIKTVRAVYPKLNGHSAQPYASEVYG